MEIKMEWYHPGNLSTEDDGGTYPYEVWSCCGSNDNHGAKMSAGCEQRLEKINH